MRSYTCVDCGQHRITEQARGRLPRRCPACARQHTAQMKRSLEQVRDLSRDARAVPCAACGKVLHGGKGALPVGQRRCNDCRRRTVRTLSCPVCQVPFVGMVATATYCSKRCSTRARVLDPTKIKPRPCIDCGTEVHSLGSIAICVGCRPQRRREARRAKDRRRRAALYAARSEPYTRAEIAARDGYACHLCSESVAMEQVVPHPRAPTIDHVIPLAGGGDDTRANVRLAHFICNVRKGTRPLAEALARL